MLLFNKVNIEEDEKERTTEYIAEWRLSLDEDGDEIVPHDGDTETDTDDEDEQPGAPIILSFDIDIERENYWSTRLLIFIVCISFSIAIMRYNLISIFIKRKPPFSYIFCCPFLFVFLDVNLIEKKHSFSLVNIMSME